MDAKLNTSDQTSACDPTIGVEFLRALFLESDKILIRPIETWVECNRKHSHVDFKGIRYISGAALRNGQAEQILRNVEQRAAAQRTNTFFGVCPRFGDRVQFDQAWQIRIVRTLWCDIDNVTADEAQVRLAKSGLPRPSVVVNSGNGIHLYWMLESPYLIDDVDDPPPVLTEWTETASGKKRPRRYLEEPGSGERLYLDIRANVPQPSPKAVYIQDVVAGIATAIGGDHTHDVSRILRVPGTKNRKDERNNRVPVPCELIACDGTLKYPLVDFAKYADESPQKRQRQQIAAVQLPSPKKLTPTKRDTLNSLAIDCAAVPVGSRSEADWRLICAAIENGWPKAEVWQAVSKIGKFAECGEEYFARTWGKAEQHVREERFQLAVEQQSARNKDPNPAGKADNLGLVPMLANQICGKERFAQDEGGKLYRYFKGVYSARGEAFVKASVKSLCKKLNRLNEWSSHVANEVVEFIRVDSPLLWERPPCDVINVQNGLLGLATKELREHTPDHLSSVQLPVVFDPSAACPKIEKFIAEVFPEDATELGYEIPCWLMTPDTSIQQAVLLLGSGGNGKSRYLRMVESFLGKANVSSLSLHRLESDRFSCARLYGKLANICPDLPTEHLAGTSVFKAITGGDPITGEYKFKNSFDFVTFSRLVFSANSPPRALDASEGFFDRWLVVPFERRFRGQLFSDNYFSRSATINFPVLAAGVGALGDN